MIEILPEHLPTILAEVIPAAVGLAGVIFIPIKEALVNPKNDEFYPLSHPPEKFQEIDDRTLFAVAKRGSGNARLAVDGDTHELRIKERHDTYHLVAEISVDGRRQAKINQRHQEAYIEGIGMFYYIPEDP